MNLTKLKNNQMQLIEFMEKGGYSQCYIQKIKYEIKELLEYGNNYQNYLEYYQKYICYKSNNLRTQNTKKGSLTLIMNFDLYDKYPDRNKRKNKIIDYSSYAHLNDYFKNIIKIYERIAREKNLKSTTIHTSALSCACFLLHLQNNNYKTLLDVQEKDIISFFLDENNNFKFSNTYAKRIKAVLSPCTPFIKECERIINLLPSTRNIRKNIQYLTQEEVMKIKEVLENNNDICLRDKAIVTIALYTGLRGCDIAQLKLSNINWDSETINIVQQKTGVNLELPLTTAVGNALYDYITKERPQTNIDNIFIRKDALYPIGKTTTNTAVNLVFKKANIRQCNNQRKGTHIFRNNLATSLLKNEVPRVIISQVLGHISPNSLDPYLSADFEHLKKCALNISMFENIREVK